MAMISSQNAILSYCSILTIVGFSILQAAFQLRVAVGAGIAAADFLDDAFQADRADVADFHADIAVLPVCAQIGFLFGFLRLFDRNAEVAFDIHLIPAVFFFVA